MFAMQTVGEADVILNLAYISGAENPKESK